MPDPTPQQQPPERPYVQTYENDLARAMDTTDATVVQELLTDARERESIEAERRTRGRERGWYTTGALILILLALGAIGYGVYYYTHLTVDVAAPVSVGIFPSTTPVNTQDTTIDSTKQTLATLIDTLPEGKPYLIPVIGPTNTAVGVEEFFSFIEARASEPFVGAFSLARLGVMHTGEHVTPFLILFAPDQTTATKELLIAEPTLLQLVAPALNIDLSKHSQEIGKQFESRYLYNLPIRTLSTTDPDRNIETILFYYAFATDHTVVISTDPTILKAIYDTVIKQ